MNRLFRIVSAFVLFVVAMVAFTAPARAAYTISSPRPPTFSSSSRLSASPTVVRYQNGTTVTYANGERFIQRYGRHAQPMVQRRDEKGRWMKAVPAKTWAPRISGFIVGASRLGVGAAKPAPSRTERK
jgi:hypothetical protein